MTESPTPVRRWARAFRSIRKEPNEMKWNRMGENKMIVSHGEDGIEQLDFPRCFLGICKGVAIVVKYNRRGALDIEFWERSSCLVATATLLTAEFAFNWELEVNNAQCSALRPQASGLSAQLSSALDPWFSGRRVRHLGAGSLYRALAVRGSLQFDLILAHYPRSLSIPTGTSNPQPSVPRLPAVHFPSAIAGVGKELPVQFPSKVRRS
ncbi:hypothetical protein EI94DRAFT_1785211 [Lactarius quietus]|nr:hypothetical protein EI94DRAFT_1785211 [Lactarius quietus]